MLLGPVLQVAYVTRDIDRACAHLGEKYGVREYYRMGPNTLETDSGELMSQKLAHAWLGPTWIEIIEPTAGTVSLFSEWLPADNSPLRLHHVGTRLADVAAWNRMVRDVQRAGLETVLSLTKNRAQKYCYVDTSADLGHYTEYMFIPDSSESIMARIPQNVRGFGLPV